MKRLSTVLIAGLAVVFLATFASGAPAASGYVHVSGEDRQLQSLSGVPIDNTQLARRSGRDRDDDDSEHHSTQPSSQAPAAPAAAYGPDDPRDQGIEVVLGEWAVTLEAAAIRPGPVTFVVRNKGTKTHGFRVRSEGGRGKDRFERRSALVPPGGETTLTLNLAAGTYRADCYVDEPGLGSHSDMGMRTTLSVRADAPLAPKKAPAPASALSVSIEKFSFSPAVITVPAGSTVVWKNNDPAPHTITADDKSFDSGVIQPGAEFKRTFDAAGSFSYKCTIHPSMTGTVVVQGK